MWRKHLLDFVGLALVAVICAFASTARAQAQAPECPHKRIWKPSSEDLRAILAAHQEWLLDKTKGRKAVLCRADLRKADLTNVSLTRANLQGAILFGVDLQGASLEEANLQDAVLTRTKLRDANLSAANLQDAILLETDLRAASLVNSKLVRARLFDANLSNANLSSADLKKASFVMTVLDGAIFARVNLTGAVYEPLSVPATGGLGHIKGLETLRFRVPANVSGLVLLRNTLAESGLRKLERKATFVIERQKAKDAPWPERWFKTIAFDWTSGFGLHPAKPLYCMFVVYVFCAIIYWLHLSRHKGGTASIVRYWPKGRIKNGSSGMEVSSDDTIEPLPRGGKAALANALYFSLLSAFHFGWRELNIGNWIARLQPRQYTLRAVGAMRFVSGLQSLLSIYFIALWALTYFGRPFQ